MLPIQMTWLDDPDSPWYPDITKITGMFGVPCIKIKKFNKTNRTVKYFNITVK